MWKTIVAFGLSLAAVVNVLLCPLYLALYERGNNGMIGENVLGLLVAANCLLLFAGVVPLMAKWPGHEWSNRWCAVLFVMIACVVGFDVYSYALHGP